MTDLVEKTRRSTSFVLPAQVITKVLGMLYIILLAKGLSVENFGIYNLLLGMLLVFSYFCNFGLGSSLQRFLPEYLKFKKYRLIIKMIFFSHLFRCVLAALFLSAAYFAFDLWAPKLNIEDRKLEFLAFAVGAFLMYQIEFFQIEFNSLFFHAASSVLQVFYSILKFIFLCAVIYFGYGLISILALEAVALGLGLIFAVVYFFTRVYPLRKKDQQDDRIEYKRVGRYSGYNALIMPGGILYSNSMDYFVIAAMANTHDLGLYALASRLSKMMTSIMPQNLLQSVIRPAFYHHYYSSEDRGRILQSMFDSLVVLIASVLLPCIAILVAAGAALIFHVFGEEFAGASNIFIFLVVMSVFTVLEFPSDMVLQAIEKVQARLYAQIFAVYNVLAAIYLMGEYGIFGVAIATGTALMFKCLFYYYFAYRYADITINKGVLAKVILNSVICGLVVYGVLAYYTSFLGLVIAMLAGILLYVLLFFKNGYLDREQKKLVNEFLKRKIFSI